MLQLEGECYSIVEIKTGWEKETCIHVELGNPIFFYIWFGFVLYRLPMINEIYCEMGEEKNVFLYLMNELIT